MMTGDFCRHRKIHSLEEERSRMTDDFCRHRKIHSLEEEEEDDR